MPLLKIFDLVPGWIYAIAVAVLLASTSTLGWLWLGSRDEVATLAVEKTQAINTAGMCTKAVSEMELRAAARRREAQPLIAAAAANAVAHELRADAILSAGPSTPGDDCKSAQDQVDTWLQGRGPP